MSKQLIFLSGLPRSGSTLLANLLAQNPLVHSTATSGLHESTRLRKGEVLGPQLSEQINQKLN